MGVLHITLLSPFRDSRDESCRRLGPFSGRMKTSLPIVPSTGGRLTSDREKQYHEFELFVVMNDVLMFVGYSELVLLDG